LFPTGFREGNIFGFRYWTDQNRLTKQKEGVLLMTSAGFGPSVPYDENISPMGT
jgi:hypothetical protein